MRPFGYEGSPLEDRRLAEAQRKIGELSMDDDEIEKLNRLGQEGREAVGMVSSWGVGWRFVHPIVLFKRPRPNGEEGSPGVSGD